MMHGQKNIKKKHQNLQCMLYGKWKGVAQSKYLQL